jgi:hypothetical protein
MKPKPTPAPLAEQLVPDDIWDAIAPLLPAHPLQPNGGRPWISDRAVLGGLIYVLRSSTPWRLLPARALAAAAVSPVGGGCGPGKPLASGSSCTIGCWPGWVTTARSTGHGRHSTA